MIKRIDKLWKSFLTKNARRAAGTIGTAPYLFYLRFLLVGALVWTLWYGSTPNASRLSVLLTVGLVASQAILLSWRIKSWATVRLAWELTAFADVVFITSARYLRPQLESDIFLLYFFPLLVGAEYLRVRWFAAMLGLAVPFAIWVSDPLQGGLVLFLWRTSYLLVTGIVAMILTRLQHAEHADLEFRSKQFQLQLGCRQKELTALYDLRRQLGELSDESQILDLTVSKIGDLANARNGGVWRYLSNTIELELQPKGGDLSDSEHKRLRELAARCAESSGVERDGMLAGVAIKSRSTFFALLFATVDSPPEEAENAATFLASLADNAGSAIARSLVIQGFREISVKTAELQLDDEAIEGILRDLTGQLEFDFAVISMVDEYQERIRHERGRNVPRGWMRRASFLLSDPKALLPDLVRSGRTEVIEGWDDRFDREIYDRFGHKDLIRVWAPIKRGTKVLGILQAGRHTRRGKLTPAVVARVEEYAENSFEVISRSRPIVLLELISRHAQNIVGAHGASVHVFNVGGPLEAGHGEISKEFVIAAGKDLKSVLVEDPESSQWLFSLIAAKSHGLCSTAAFRLNLDDDQAGVLCVHFTSQHDFNPGEVDLLRSFAGLVSVSLLDNHLLTKLSSTTELAWTVSSLQRILEALSSTAPLSDLLQELTDRMLAMFDADCVVLHQFDEARQDFSPSPVMSGRFNAPDVVKRPLTRDALPWKIMVTGTVFAGPDDVGRWAGSIEGAASFASRENVHKCAALLLKIGPETKPVGVLFINYRKRETRDQSSEPFTAEQVEAMRALASSATIAIQAATGREVAEASHQAEHDALVDIDHFILKNYTDLKLTEVLAKILLAAGTISRAKGGVLMKYDAFSGVLRPMHSFGAPFSRLPREQRLGSGIVGLAGEKGHPILVDNVNADQWKELYIPWTDDTRSQLAVPIVDGDQLIGVINLEHPETGHFRVEHQVLVQTLALQGVIASRSDQLLTGDLRLLKVYNLVAKEIADTRRDLGKVLKLILTGITAEGGLGFSRSVFFALDGSVVRALAAIGPVDAIEAQMIWSGLATVSLESLLGHATENESGSNILESLVKHAIPVADIPGLEHAVRGSAVVVGRGEDGPLRRLYTRLGLGDSEFGFFPIVPSGDPRVAFLVVDRAFQPETSFAERELIRLGPFAEMAGISIQREQIRRQFSSGDSDTSESELISQVLHDVDRKVGAIRRTMSRFRSKHREALVNLPMAAQELDVIEHTMAGASETVHRLRWLDQPARALRTIDVGEILSSLRSWPEWTLDCPVIFEIPEGRLECQVNRESFTDMLLELIRNGRQAALFGARRHKEVSVRAAKVGEELRIAIRDTGDGVPEVHKARIWEMYFSTRPDGKGVGLPMALRIVEDHQGTLRLNDLSGGGSEFLITMPLRMTNRFTG